MGKIERLVIGGLALILAILVAASSFGYFREEEDVVRNVSVIVNHTNDDFWKIYKKGMEQAASDYNVDVRFVTLYDENDASQQMELLLREIENGVEAVILASAAGEELETMLMEAKVDIPLITVQSALNFDKVVSYVGADNGAMGRAMGEQLQADGMEQIIICGDADRTQALEARAQAIEQYCEESGMVCVRQTEALEEAVHKPGTALVAIEEDMVIRFCEMYPDGTAESPSLYGFGYTYYALNHMESGILSGLMVINRYDEGYLSLKQAVYAIDHKEQAEVSLDFFYITKEQIYEKEYQKLLFPIS